MASVEIENKKRMPKKLFKLYFVYVSLFNNSECIGYSI
jgi:hypothetical protein